MFHIEDGNHGVVCDGLLTKSFGFLFSSLLFLFFSFVLLLCLA